MKPLSPIQRGMLKVRAELLSSYREQLTFLIDLKMHNIFNSPLVRVINDALRYCITQYNEVKRNNDSAKNPVHRGNIRRLGKRFEVKDNHTGDAAVSGEIG